MDVKELLHCENTFPANLRAFGSVGKCRSQTTLFRFSRDFRMTSHFLFTDYPI